ncbi:radical SAM family heme chaperone HemW [Clostridiaceae bacterium AF02-42]|uniref:radical SAM family heme chaperone HemW n=1 Tax=Clostridium sp. AF28-12 TaxID=2305241 RepID=UPI000E3F7810|nr:radical SAM family heme chaperone HemW [Clostridium sp. AF28-12]RGD99677.1 radical SAM family heme chaperone HemW [Clostridium sp. AF28-12]RGE00361.1 radical SAM family heme chaperone HemW [Clostridiaceae bacterium AF02-42]
MNGGMELYLHMPFCVRKCAYCDFLSFPTDQETQNLYTRRLREDIDAMGKKYGDIPVDTIFIGGGTPSVPDSALIVGIMEHVRKAFHVAEGAEISMEANPGTVTREKLTDYRWAGINRLSFGLQSANDRELKLLGRIHTWAEFLESFHLARECGFTNINIDLMSALPGQTRESWKDTLKRVTDLNPEHISAYSLIIEDGTPFGEKYGSEEGRKLLPDEDSEREMYHETKRFLRDCGYERYEISNYAKPGRACRHNIGYWTGLPYLGLGLGASSYMDGCRFAVNSDMKQYLEEKPGMFTDVEKLTKKDMEEEFFYVGLRMTAGVSLPEFERRFGVSAKDVYPGLMETFVEEKAAVFQGDRFVLTDYGLDVSNYIMAQFLQD